MSDHTPAKQPRTNKNPHKYNIFIHHPYVVGVFFLIASVLLTNNIGKLKEQIASVVSDISKIRNDTKILKECLVGEIKDGQKVTIGINNKEIKDNGLVVFADNTYNLVEGDSVLLTNYLDDKYQTTLKFFVQRTPKRNGDTSKAEMFMSLDAAKRLDLLSGYKYQGVYTVKMMRKLKAPQNQAQ